MCLGIPMRLLAVAADGSSGTAETGGVKRDVRLDLVEDAAVGDYVLIHAGYAIQKLSEEEAAETIALLREFIHDNEEGSELL